MMIDFALALMNSRGSLLKELALFSSAKLLWDDDEKLMKFFVTLIFRFTVRAVVKL
jgi:hypothetical protein